MGIDLGTKLSSWNTQLVEVLWFELNESGTDRPRPFLVTERIPEHGRSGGGLFDRTGKLVGVCVGHAELVKGKRMGVFSSIENVRQLLREHELTSVIERSEARQARLARNADLSGRRLTLPSRSVVTPTEVTHESDMRWPRPGQATAGNRGGLNQDRLPEALACGSSARRHRRRCILKNKMKKMTVNDPKMAIL